MEEEPETADRITGTIASLLESCISKVLPRFARNVAISLVSSVKIASDPRDTGRWALVPS